MRRRLVSVVGGLLVVGALCSSARPARAATGLNDVLGAIANAYGTLQATQFVLSFFGVGASTQMAQAVTEIENFIQNYRDSQLVQNVNADLNLFLFISSNYQSGLTNDLESIFISNCISDLSSLQGDIQNGNIDDAYALAPAYNLLTVAFVGAVKAFGIVNPANAYPQSTLDSYLSAAASVDYTLVGGFLVTYDVVCPSCGSGGGYTNLVDTQGRKKMWPKYASSLACYPSPINCLNVGEYYCDLTAPQNADENFLHGCYHVGSFGSSIMNPLPSTVLSFYQSQLNNDRTAFDADQSVAAVRASIAGLIPLGFNEIFDWNGSPFIAIGHVLIA